MKMILTAFALTALPALNAHAVGSSPCSWVNASPSCNWNSSSTTLAENQKILVRNESAFSGRVRVDVTKIKIGDVAGSVDSPSNPESVMQTFLRVRAQCRKNGGDCSITEASLRPLGLDLSMLNEFAMDNSAIIEFGTFTGLDFSHRNVVISEEEMMKDLREVMKTVVVHGKAELSIKKTYAKVRTVVTMKTTGALVSDTTKEGCQLLDNKTVSVQAPDAHEFVIGLLRAQAQKAGDLDFTDLSLEQCRDLM